MNVKSEVPMLPEASRTRIKSTLDVQLAWTTVSVDTAEVELPELRDTVVDSPDVEVEH